ncbi:unnamed protein product [marine sediment metagenome]|uniref:Uncharacterized protein n=1 Tax=marine sediment metagenome TaxID=412755 RepID=X0ZB52_9ZZZZ
MPRGLKPTSSPIIISFGLTESGSNTFTTDRVDLQLNALDNEVFVVTGVKMDTEIPDMLPGVPGARHAVFASCSKQNISNASDRTLANTSVFATANVQIMTAVSATAGLAVLQQENDVDTPQAMEYLDIIATPDFFVNINGVNNSSAKSVEGKLYGYRATADASTYAALVQSELISQ